MKKRVQLMAALIIVIILFCIVAVKQNQMVRLKVDKDEFYISINVDDRTENIYPWYNENEDIYYVFLPSCVKKEIIYIDSIFGSIIKINNFPVERKFGWNQGEVYDMAINNMLYRITFMKSANIPAFFIEADSGSMNYIHENKDHEESGNLTVINADGNSQYSGKLTRISGRGNSTWLPQAKKPYSIALTDKYPLCGLSAGKEWKLLSLYFEHDKIHSKIIYDLGREIGIENTPECIWVDLYCHGEYKGLYLLTEDISQKENDEDKYLIEKTIGQQVRIDESSFTTQQSDMIFKFARPRYPTQEQLEKAIRAVANLDDLLAQKDIQYINYIDIDSFAKQFLIDKVVMEADAMGMSTFFYIEGEQISAGPLWDYDRAIGEIYSDYTTPIEGDPNGMSGWYMTLYENKEFHDAMIRYYIECLPRFQKILEKDIDDYAEYIKASVKMDDVLMKNLTTANETVSYQNYDSYIKYLKYFLANRLNYLSDLWQVDAADFKVPESTNEFYQVDFALEDGTVLETKYIRDGECIENVPEFDTSRYSAWYFNGRPKCYDKPYTYLIPIYEDTVLYAKEKE